MVAIALFPSVSFAGTLVCANERVAFTFDATESGAFRANIERLILDGRVLLERPLNPEKFKAEAEFLLEGSPNVIKVVELDEFHVATYFEQNARVNSIANESNQGGATLFTGNVFCKQVVYNGPPLP